RTSAVRRIWLRQAQRSAARSAPSTISALTVTAAMPNFLTWSRLYRTVGRSDTIPVVTYRRLLSFRARFQPGVADGPPERGHYESGGHDDAARIDRGRLPGGGVRRERRAGAASEGRQAGGRSVSAADLRRNDRRAAQDDRASARG